MERQERRTKTGGKRRRRLGDPALCASQFGGEAGQEMVLRLVGRQARYRWQNAESIGREENHLTSVSRFGNRFDDVVNMVNGIGDAGVLRFAAIVKIHAAIFPYRDILQQRIAFDGTVNIRFCFFLQFDGFGVAAAFKVKHAVIIPAVFVVANQLALRIGGQRGFSGAGQT